MTGAGRRRRESSWRSSTSGSARRWPRSAPRCAPGPSAGTSCSTRRRRPRRRLSRRCSRPGRTACATGATSSRGRAPHRAHRARARQRAARPRGRAPVAGDPLLDPPPDPRLRPRAPEPGYPFSLRVSVDYQLSAGGLVAALRAVDEPRPRPVRSGTPTKRHSASVRQSTTACPTPPRLGFIDGDVSFWRPGAEEWAAGQGEHAARRRRRALHRASGNVGAADRPRAFVRAGAERSSVSTRSSRTTCSSR